VRIKLLVFTIITLTSLSICAAGTKSLSRLEAPDSDSEPVLNVFRTETGALVVWNESTAHFTVEIVTSTFYQGAGEGVAFLLNGHFISVLTANPRHFDVSPLEPQVRIMREYKKWETAYWEEQLNSPLESVQINEVPGAETVLSCGGWTGQRSGASRKV